MYKIETSHEFKKSLKGISKKDIEKIFIKIKSLAVNPRQGDVEDLHGKLQGLYRIRQGNYRIIYKIFDDILVVMVLKVSDRKEAYKKR